MSNYRLISLLSIFSKIFEKNNVSSPLQFFDKFGRLYNMRFGLRKSHSTDHALVILNESIKSSLDNNRVGCGIFIDLQRAFDAVNYNTMLKKLEHYGIRGDALSWFTSYLPHRTQFVSINGTSSATRSITCGDLS